MPAIITHDTFGHQLYKKHYQCIGETRDDLEAFLLGNQGPDPLFFSILVPRLHSVSDLASRMHQEKPNELLESLKRSLSVLDERELPVGRAYALGFLCHYLLDSRVHPLVYFYTYQFCNAGVEGLSAEHNHELHATIESELDEMVLYTQWDETVATFNPSQRILKGSNFALATISKMYDYLALSTYGIRIPQNTFASSLRSYRRAETVFSSPSGAKRAALGALEELVRPYSFIRAMSPRALEITESQFDNHEHQNWENPFTDEVSSEGFWDRYHHSFAEAEEVFRLFDREDFDQTVAQTITHDLNFNGEPTVAILEVEPDTPALETNIKIEEPDA